MSNVPYAVGDPIHGAVITGLHEEPVNGRVISIAPVKRSTEPMTWRVTALLQTGHTVHWIVDDYGRGGQVAPGYVAESTVAG
ncbi:MAG TPA: hypothetical protein VGH11_05170 [Jatrophihabitans sp.]